VATSQPDLPPGPHSIIAWPSAGQTIPAPGLWEIRGIAWGGDGILDRVPWTWDGRETVIMSRAVDGLGQVQPTRAEMPPQYGPSVIHYPNDTRFRWLVRADGSVTGGLTQA
jgi:sulfane dehydrogenase subunit SoxC